MNKAIDDLLSTRATKISNSSEIASENSTANTSANTSVNTTDTSNSSGTGVDSKSDFDDTKANTQKLLSKLNQAGIRIALGENDKLKIRAPKGALTDELKKDLKQSKEQIIVLLKSQAKEQSSKPAKASSNIPLSFTQERLWFLDQLEGATNLYNMPGLFKLTGTIHLDKLQQAFKEIVQRHEVLRTHFLTHKGKGLAQLNSNGQWQLEQFDLTEYSEQQIVEKTDLMICEQLASSFDLTQDCLFRTFLIKQSEQTSILMLNMHHIISDGWSVQVLIREFISLYTSFVEGKAVELEALPIQYADYAHWQKNHLQGETLDESLSYWRKQLEGVQVLEMPTDFQRPAVQTSQGALYTFSLDNQLITQLKETAQQQGVTLFMMLLAGLSILLSRYSAQDDICIGSPIANRNRKELQNLIGFFANTLVFRQKLQPGQTLGEFLQIIKKNTIDAYEYQETPFEKVVDGLNIERSLSHSPLFQVMLVLQNIAQEGIELPGMEIESLPFDSGSAKFDLTFTVEEAQSADSKRPVAVTIEYNTALFKQETIENLSGHFTRVLEVLGQTDVQNALEQDITRIEFLSETERHKQLSDWQVDPIEIEPFLSIQHRFEQQVEKTPDAIALTCGSHSLTYQQMNVQVNQLADYLKQKGIGRGQSVGICLNRSVEMIISVYGIIKAGADYIPMDINYPRERLLYMLSESQAPLLITNSELQDKLNVSEDKVFLADHQWQELTAYSQDNPAIFDLREEPLYTIFTSGSTGRPKGAQVHHKGQLNLITWYIREFDMTSDDNILLVSAFGFDQTQKNIFASLVCGATLVLPTIDHYDYRYLTKAINEYQISWLNCAPSLFYPLIDDEKQWNDLQTLRYVFLGGEPINLQKVYDWEAQTQCKLVNTYGPTEATDTNSFHVLDATEDYTNKAFPIGRAVDNNLLYILDEQLGLLPEGCTGELYIAGVCVGLGYINQPELTQKIFIPDPYANDGSLMYKTGDLVRYQSEGVIEYVGRVDFQVKLRGLRIELSEIEFHLGELESISDGVVRVVKDSNNVEQLVAYIVTTQTIDTAQLREKLVDYLPEYMIPNHYIEMDVLPLTPNGKVDNKALPALEIKSSEENYQAPETEEEKILCQIWKDILKIEKVGTFDNFFEMGGDSILSIQIISRATEEGLSLHPKDIFEHQNIARLALHAQNNASKQSEMLLTEQGELSGELLLSPVQSRFLQQDFVNKDHWNQSILLTVPKELTQEVLNKAFTLLVAQHDVLHSQFSKTEQGNWSQSYIKQDKNASLVVNETLNGSYESELEIIANHYQSSLSIEEGRLLQAVLFNSEVDTILRVSVYLLLFTILWLMGFHGECCSRICKKFVRHFSLKVMKLA